MEIAIVKNKETTDNKNNRLGKIMGGCKTFYSTPKE